MKERFGEFTAAILTVFAFVLLVWFLVWRNNGVMETLYRVAQLMIAIPAAGVAVTLFIFYEKPAIRELVQRDFWLSTAFIVTFALMGLCFVSMAVTPITQIHVVTLGSLSAFGIWLTLMWLFLMKRLMVFASSPTISEAAEARKVIAEAEEVIRQAKEIE